MTSILFKVLYNLSNQPLTFSLVTVLSHFAPAFTSYFVIPWAFAHTICTGNVLFCFFTYWRSVSALDSYHVWHSVCSFPLTPEAEWVSPPLSPRALHLPLVMAHCDCIWVHLSISVGRNGTWHIEGIKYVYIEWINKRMKGNGQGVYCKVFIWIKFKKTGCLCCSSY